MMEHGLFSGTSFHGGPAHPSSSSFAQKLLVDQPNMQELNSFNSSDDFLFGLPFEAADLNQDLLFADAAEVKEGPKRRRPVPEIDDQRERKKQNDKRYRDRVKNERERIKQQLHDLKAENGSLIHEIEYLRGENGRMNQNLESSTEHMRELSSSHNQLKREFTRQESTVKALLSKLSPETDMAIIKQKQESEMQRLKEAIYSQDLNEMDHIIEKLLNENMRLKKQNMILQVNMEALCEKIQNDKHQN